MMANNTSLSALLLMLVTLFVTLINSPTTAFAAAKDYPTGARSPAPTPLDEPYKVVNEFCKQRSSKDDQEFCLTALKSDPRSASAKDNVALLYISDDLAVDNANKTRDYLIALSKGKEPKQPPLITALKECISAYHLGISELEILPKDFQDDPALASYDAHEAGDALFSCRDSLNRNNITDQRILTRLKISIAYVRLCLDIANKF